MKRLPLTGTPVHPVPYTFCSSFIPLQSKVKPLLFFPASVLLSFCTGWDLAYGAGETSFIARCYPELSPIQKQLIICAQNLQCWEQAKQKSKPDTMRSFSETESAASGAETICITSLSLSTGPVTCKTMANWLIPVFRSGTKGDHDSNVGYAFRSLVLLHKFNQPLCPALGIA